MKISSLGDVAVTPPTSSEIDASSRRSQKRVSPALASATVAILLIMNGFIVGGLLVLEVALMSSCSRIVLRFFWSLVWTSVVAAYFYYWLIVIA